MAACMALFGLSWLLIGMASISPLIAGYLYQNWGMTATLFFVAGPFAISAVIFASADFKQTHDAGVKASGD